MQFVSVRSNSFGNSCVNMICQVSILHKLGKPYTHPHMIISTQLRNTALNHKIHCLTSCQSEGNKGYRKKREKTRPPQDFHLDFLAYCANALVNKYLYKTPLHTTYMTLGK